MPDVKMSRTYTPPTTGRTLYAGSTYPLSEEVAFEVVEGQGAGHRVTEDGIAEEKAEATVAELKERAKELGVEGYSSMNKADLAAAVEAKEVE